VHIILIPILTLNGLSILLSSPDSFNFSIVSEFWNSKRNRSHYSVCDNSWFIRPTLKIIWTAPEMSDWSNIHQTMDNTTTSTLWPESASELYRPSDRHLSAKLVPIFADRGVPQGIRHADHVAPSIRKSGTNVANSGGRTVGTVRSRTQATEFSFSTLPLGNAMGRAHLRDIRKACEGLTTKP
jgi:hypothetical protein